MRLNLRQVRKSVAQRTVGKVVAGGLAVALVVPPQLGYGFSLAYAGGGK